MGFYRERVLPRITDIACGAKDLDRLRRRVCQDLTGQVVEIGFGSGSNVRFYPASVTRVTAIEPARLGWELADKCVKAATVPVQSSGPDGQHLSFPDDSFDCALSTRSLCTIPDVAASLTELRRGRNPPGASISSTTAWPLTSRCAVGNDVQSRCRKGCSAAAG